MIYADMVEDSAGKEFDKFVSNMDAFKRSDENIQSLVKSFFLIGYMIGVRSMISEVKIEKENNSVKSQLRTVVG